MILLAVFTPMINFLIFVLFGSFVHRKQLARLTIASMFSLLGILLASAPNVIAGQVKTASLGA